MLLIFSAIRSSGVIVVDDDDGYSKSSARDNDIERNIRSISTLCQPGSSDYSAELGFRIKQRRIINAPRIDHIGLDRPTIFAFLELVTRFI